MKYTKNLKVQIKKFKDLTEAYWYDAKIEDGVDSQIFFEDSYYGLSEEYNNTLSLYILPKEMKLKHINHIKSLGRDTFKKYYER